MPCLVCHNLDTGFGIRGKPERAGPAGCSATGYCVRLSAGAARKVGPNHSMVRAMPVEKQILSGIYEPIHSAEIGRHQIPPVIVDVISRRERRHKLVDIATYDLVRDVDGYRIRRRNFR